MKTTALYICTCTPPQGCEPFYYNHEHNHCQREVGNALPPVQRPTLSYPQSDVCNQECCCTKSHNRPSIYLYRAPRTCVPNLVAASCSRRLKPPSIASGTASAPTQDRVFGPAPTLTLPMPHPHRHANTEVTATAGVPAPHPRRTDLASQGQSLSVQTLAAPATPLASCSSLFPSPRPSIQMSAEGLEIHLNPRTARYREGGFRSEDRYYGLWPQSEDVGQHAAVLNRCLQGLVFRISFRFACSILVSITIDCFLQGSCRSLMSM